MAGLLRLTSKWRGQPYALVLARRSTTERINAAHRTGWALTHYLRVDARDGRRLASPGSRDGFATDRGTGRAESTTNGPSALGCLACKAGPCSFPQPFWRS